MASIHLVGGVPLDACDVFELAGQDFGARAKRIPDGEKKRGWLRPQAPIIGAAQGMVAGSTGQWLARTSQRYRPAPGQDPAALRFGPLGYLSAALESYEIFKSVRAAGTIASATRFQISLPTAFGAVAHCVDPDAMGDVWPPYEAQLFAELQETASRIPAGDLAVQWDIAVEITQSLDNPHGSNVEYGMDEFADAVARGLDCLPAGVEGGIHLCYGDAGEDKHYIEPKDMGVMVAFHNAIAARAKHSLDWVHMPVPKARDDAAYFAPLAHISLRPETELVLGLVHRLDGIEGARRKVAAAKRFAPRFGVGTECGMGRYIEARHIPGLFALHRQVAEVAEA